MRIVNLTPHKINFVKDDGTTLATIESSGVCRVFCSTVVAGGIDGTPTTEIKYGEVEGLPDPEDGAVYVVSTLVDGKQIGVAFQMNQ